MTLDTSDWAMELVLCATNLQKLTLDFEFDHPSSFVDRLSSADSFPKLRELKLSCAYVTVGIISRFLLRFRNSLRALLFRHVIIDDEPSLTRCNWGWISGRSSSAMTLS